MTTNTSDIREHEVSLELPDADDAQLRFIGRIHTPWSMRTDCPRQGKLDGPICKVELFEPWGPALKGLDKYEHLELLYWLNQARRDLLVQNPGHDGKTFGTFALRSPVRPNPIGTSMVRLESIDGQVLSVRGLDCLDGTPLIDIKPKR
ncbi:tRNA (N6-threonylcarbamoyladenosine(37)-N6)-methyltransferase TrmO [Aquicoccus sp. G2-2]|uniref:tRNA (N6-threonylcarbamoyladenosine(37)-N6)-methyltransferase TrmO n=1 Tax=Aquicoccus sp. G2-2 TaxID=3092120 RepID=UPI002ADF0601|nr:tRNA (N6-threonylcarbamoyladenosine(37)-N6)-methyltransferase TrmO [Aquicoccus sp. G2-2]MEA1115319.1 tRNA (N6-threonylcarbamoyladenosine(37)-N6)-methyltransferase TrmO [Aquicoccus sp. G2-2]